MYAYGYLFGPRGSGTSSSSARCSDDASGQFSRPSSAHIAAAASRDSSGASFVYSTPRPHLHSTFGQWNTRMLVIMARILPSGEAATGSSLPLGPTRVHGVGDAAVLVDVLVSSAILATASEPGLVEGGGVILTVGAQGAAFRRPSAAVGAAGLF